MDINLPDVSVKTDRFERIEKFQSLLAGQYWKAMTDFPDKAIPAGQVLLIESIKWVDNQAHTIVLRAHPSVYDQRIDVVEQSDGKEIKRIVRATSWPFLVQDFLRGFEFEPDHEKIRENELNQVQEEIQSLQQELIEAQSNPEILKAHIQKELSKSVSDSDGSQGALMSPTDLKQLAQMNMADALGMGMTTESIDSFKGAAQQQHTIATIKAQWMNDKTGEIANTIQKMTPYYKEKAACALAQTEDVRSRVEELIQGIASLTLYTGDEVKVYTIRKGDSAPWTIPLTLVQRKLMMDEEFALWSDVDRSFDYRKKQVFFDALLEEEGMIDQIFPTQRCILVMATTRRYIDYQTDAYTQEVRSRMNANVFMLARDGENIHMILSPIESHLGTARLFPSKDEQDRIFKGYDGKDITFNDIAYTSKLDNHQRFALHYKRFLILLCGLDHRLKLFGNFYPGEPDFSFMTQAFQSRYMSFLHDDDGEGLLGNKQMPPLSEFMYDNQENIVPGSRVMVFWEEFMSPSNAPGAYSASRIISQTRFPVEPFSEVVVALRDGKKVVFCPCTRHGSDKISKVMVEISSRGIRDGILCLDKLSKNELVHYIHSRDDREDHLMYVRLFKRAIDALSVSEDQEADSKELLRSHLHGRTDVASIENAITQLIGIWRISGKGKPFPTPDNLTPEVWLRLTKQLDALVESGSETVSEVETLSQKEGLLPLRLVMTSKADWVLYAEIPMDSRDDRLEADPWVYEIKLTGTNKLRLPKQNSFKRVLLPKHDGAVHIIHEWDGVVEWIGKRSGFDSFEYKQSILSRGRELPFMSKYLRMGAGDFSYESLLENWESTRDKMVKQSRIVPELAIDLPLGVVMSGDNHQVSLLCISREAMSFLRELCPSEQALKDLRRRYIRPFADKDYARSNFERPVGKGTGWTLVLRSISDESLFRQRSCSPLANAVEHVLVSQQLELFIAKNTRISLYIHPDLYDEEGSLMVDNMLGISTPEDYEPVSVYRYEVQGKVIYQILPISSSSSINNVTSGQPFVMYHMGSYLNRMDAKESIETNAEGMEQVNYAKIDESEGLEENFYFKET